MDNQKARSNRFVIVGAGIAGVSAAETIHKAEPLSQITLICKETLPPYFRMNLTRYLAGELDAAKLPLHPQDWYLSNHIDLLLNSLAVDIDSKEHFVLLEDGRKVPYDRLILTTGASPFVPPIKGADKKGVMTLRTIQDADAILETCDTPIQVVCIGGGLLGLEVAGAISRHGVKVTVIETFDWLLPRQLDKSASAVLQKKIEAMGINVVTGGKTKEFEGDDRVRAVVLGDGRTFQADLVLISAGVSPNLDLARKAGLQINRGILVDDQMRTSVEDIFAAGDDAEHHGRLYGLWVPAKAQGTIAGLNAVGKEAAFVGDPPSARLKVLGIDLFSIGQFSPAEAEDFVIAKASDGNYASFTFRLGLMIGAILIGDARQAAVVKKAVEEQHDFAGKVEATSSVEDVLGVLGG